VILHCCGVLLWCSALSACVFCLDEFLWFVCFQQKMACRTGFLRSGSYELGSFSVLFSKCHEELGNNFWTPPVKGEVASVFLLESA
jgi:hypothetical protein